MNTDGIRGHNSPQHAASATSAFFSRYLCLGFRLACFAAWGIQAEAAPLCNDFSVQKLICVKISLGKRLLCKSFCVYKFLCVRATLCKSFCVESFLKRNSILFPHATFVFVCVLFFGQTKETTTKQKLKHMSTYKWQQLFNLQRVAFSLKGREGGLSQNFGKRLVKWKLRVVS